MDVLHVKSASFCQATAGNYTQWYIVRMLFAEHSDETYCNCYDNDQGLIISSLCMHSLLRNLCVAVGVSVSESIIASHRAISLRRTLPASKQYDADPSEPTPGVTLQLGISAVQTYMLKTASACERLVRQVRGSPKPLMLATAD